ncbi:O-antigen polymerase [Simiduia agarivorans SA1 = DSM 21679]|uniref:O-antigen polymerase n=2 Tax=Simiduia TaxID=447467 RepID=K4KND1_SIMAS|nr:O-antigen polymerase [Simiduia agarivorans SA1 = DSM 21679]
MAFLIALPVLLLFARAVADGTVLLTGLAFVWLSWRRADWQWLQQPWVRAGLALWLLLLMLTALAPDPARSFIYAAFFGRWILFAAALQCWLLADLPARRLVQASLIGVLAFVLFDSFWQYFTGFNVWGDAKFTSVRLTGPFGDPSPGVLCIKVLFIAAAGIYALQAGKGFWQQFIVLLATLNLGLLFIFATGERMPFMMYGLGMVVVLVALMLAHKGRRLLMTSVFLLASGLIVFTAYQQKATWHRTVVTTVDTLANFWQTPYGQVIESGYQVWLDRPLLGHGIHTYKKACNALKEQGGVAHCFHHPHNIYLHWLVEAGIIGLAGFLVLLGLLLRASCNHLWAQRRWMPLGFVWATYLATFWPIAASPGMFNNWMAGLIWFGIGWSLAVNQDAGRLGPDHHVI